MIRKTVNRSDAAGPLLAASVGIAALVLAGLRGVLGAARQDDWSYLAVTFHLSSTGEFQLNGWVHMMLLGQAALGSLAATEIATLQIATLCVGVLGLSVLFFIARRILPVAWSFVAVLIVGLNPVWQLSSVSFMTDVWAWTLMLLSLWMFLRGWEQGRISPLVTGSVFGFLAFTVREYSVISTLALLVFSVYSAQNPKVRRVSAIAMAILLIACVGLYAWRISLPGGVATIPTPPGERVQQLAQLAMSLFLMLAPFAALLACRLDLRMLSSYRVAKADVWGAAVGFTLWAAIVLFSGGHLLGNAIHPYGSSWTSVGDGVLSLPRPLLQLLSLVAAASGLLMLIGFGLIVGRLIRGGYRAGYRFKQESRSSIAILVVVSIAVLTASAAAVLVLGLPVFDRYLIFALPLLGIVVLGLPALCGQRWLPHSSLRTVLSAAVLVIYALLSLAIVDSQNQIDGLRWKTGQSIAAQGIPTYKVDAGDAWFRYHQKDAPGVAQVGSLQNSIPGRTWWQTFFEGSTFCRMVAIESETDLQAMYGPALSVLEERTLLGAPFRVMVFPGPDPC